MEHNTKQKIAQRAYSIKQTAKRLSDEYTQSELEEMSLHDRSEAIRKVWEQVRAQAEHERLTH